MNNLQSSAARNHLPARRRQRFPLPRTLLILLLSLAATMLLAACGGDDDTGPTGPGAGDPDPDPGLGLPATMDTWVDGDDSSANHGGEAVLHLGRDRDGLLQFSLEPLGTDAVITGMTLHLTQTAATGADAGTVTVTWIGADGWVEDEVTASDAPDETGETLGSVGVAALDSGDRALTFATSVATAKTASEQLYGNRLLSLRLTSATDLSFHSREASDAAVRPRLEVRVEDGTRVELVALENGFAWTQDRDSTYAAVDSLIVDRTSAYTYVKFDLGSLPSGAELHFAGLEMRAFIGHAFGGDGNVYTMLVADDTWSPQTLTYDNQPAAVGDRLGHWWLWYNQSHGPIDKQGRNHSPLLRPVVQSELDGDRVLSLRLDSPGYRTVYYRNDAELMEERPRLILVYTD